MVRHSVGRCITLCVLSLGLAATAGAQSQVYVLYPGSGSFTCSVHPCFGPTVHLVNTVTGHDLGSIETAPPGQNGSSVRLASDGARLFVTSNSFIGIGVPGQLSIVDAVAKVVLAHVTVGVGAADVAILPDNSRAYVVNTTDNSVSVIDLSSFSVVATVPVQSAPTRIVAAPNGGAVYVTNSGSGTVSKISTTNNSIAATINVGTDPTGLDISPDGSRLFVANSESLTVSVIDAALDSLLRDLPAGSPTIAPTNVSAQSSTRVYVELQEHGQIFQFDPSSVTLLDAATGAAQGSVTLFPGAFARDSSGNPTYVVDASFTLKRLAADSGSATVVWSPAVRPLFQSIVSAAVITDPCAFESCRAGELRAQSARRRGGLRHQVRGNRLSDRRRKSADRHLQRRVLCAQHALPQLQRRASRHHHGGAGARPRRHRGARSWNRADAI